MSNGSPTLSDRGARFVGRVHHVGDSCGRRRRDPERAHHRRLQREPRARRLRGHGADELDEPLHARLDPERQELRERPHHAARILQ